jgi:hypothetical protein
VESILLDIHASLLFRAETSRAVETYPTRHVIHKLGASHNIVVRSIRVIEWLCHDMQVPFADHNFSFILMTHTLVVDNQLVCKTNEPADSLTKSVRAPNRKAPEFTHIAQKTWAD